MESTVQQANQLIQIAQTVGMVIPLVGFMFMFYKEQTRSTIYLLIADMGAFIMNASYLLMIKAEGGQEAMVTLKMQSFGLVMFNLFFAAFVVSYIRIPVPKAFFYIWGFGEAINIFLMWNDKYRGKAYKEIEFFADERLDVQYVKIDQGLITPIRSGFVSVVILCLFCFALYRIITAATHSERHSMIRLLLANFVICGAQIIDTWGFINFSLMPIASSVSIMIIILSVLTGEFYNVTDMGREWAVDNLNEIFIIVDAKYRILYANQFAKKIMKENFKSFMSEELAQQPQNFPKCPTDKVKECLIPNKPVPDQIKEAIDNGRGTVEMCGRHYDSMVSALKRKNEIVGYSLILLDNTNTIELMRSLEEQRDIANEAVKARSDFMSNMSHEIRTPMNAIVGMTDIVLRDDRVPKEDVGYLMNIKNSGKALLAIINDILDFSKIDAGKMELVCDTYQPMSMLNDIRMIILNRIGSKPIDLIFNIDERLPAALYGDSLRLRQVIINIANNAAKFTEQGSITLTLRIENEDAENLELFFSVKDTGQGIREEDMGKLFQQFSQVDTTKNHSKEGTGLGLALSKQIIEMMGGEIGVKSQYGVGSEFYFTIFQERRSDELAGSIDEAYKFTKIEEHVDFEAPEALILLVDDNSMNIKVATGLLSPLKMKIDTAENGQEAVTKAKLNDYDLILMDHMMPIMDGCEATRRIRAFDDEKKKNVPIIALTADVVESSRLEFEECGMNDFVAKPIEFRKICDSIRKWLPEELVQISSRNAEQNQGQEPGNIKAEADFEKLPEGNINLNDAETKSPYDENSNRDKAAFEELENYGFSHSDGVKFSGSEELLIELLGDFYNLTDMKATKIEKSLADGLIRDYTVEVHALKSTARMIGFATLSERFKHLEELGNAGDIEAMKAETPGVLEAYRELKEPLRYFGRMQESEKRPASTEEITEYLRAMKDAVDAFDMDMVDESLNKLLECQLPDEIGDAADKLRAYVADFAMEDIISCADDILSKLT